MSKKFHEITPDEELDFVEGEENQEPGYEGPIKRRVNYVATNWKPMGQGFLAGMAIGAITGSIATAMVLTSDDEEESPDYEETESSENENESDE